ncbi:putative cyclin-A3-1 isoform X2 [Citrus sinensis]|uniref:putative cyclin-A3-1 isoform X2 n=1 Tax=Citrus clementina TaxID=85681 RepID=UPI000CECE6AF|nr:putative cyclin-A3-1 isoform X2 [Citrus x clementina]XP_024957721.2 putative cyclin-A3-1 isoform X2 [Citrus sinensis]
MGNADADQENSVRDPRSSSKNRASLFSSASPPRHHALETPRRVVLGELTNSFNAGSSQCSDSHNTQKPKRILKRKYGEDTLESIQRESKETKNENEELAERKSNESLSALRNCAYSSSIYKHLRSLEIEDKTRPLPNYLEKVQNDISINMRQTLVDWLVEVLEEYKLVSDTLYLTVSYVDRFLSSHALSRNKLQLLGVCCMLIASKYEEISPPHVEDFCYITDNTYMKEEVVEMEEKVLEFLNFEMGSPTTKSFLRIFTRVTEENCKKPDLPYEFLSCYLAELSLLDYGCLRYLPSLVAASSIFLSRFIMQPKIHPWSWELQTFSGYRPSDLKECVLAIHDLYNKRKANSSQAIREKYMQHKNQLNDLLVWITV